jgi:hypothetical protein
MPRRVPSIDKIMRAVNWLPTIGLEGILTSVVEHFRHRTPALAGVIEYQRRSRTIALPQSA